MSVLKNMMFECFVSSIFLRAASMHCLQFLELICATCTQQHAFSSIVSSMLQCLHQKPEILRSSVEHEFGASCENVNFWSNHRGQSPF